MKKYNNYILTLIVGLLSIIPLEGWCAAITVQGPTQVAAGEQFYLRYVVNTTDVKGFRMGQVPDAFEVLMGPSTSTQQSFSYVNGQSKHTSSVTYTYVLMATKNGTFVIPPAKAQVEGSNAQSQALRITVSGKAAQQQSSGSRMQQQQASRVDRAGSRISGNDLFISVTANKHRVHEQEPVLLTYKVFTQVELTQLEGKMPDLNGFHTQEIPLPQQKQFHIEKVNGKPYRCVTWSQYVMFPQMSGKLEIPSITFKGIVVQENPNVDPFEAFFNGGSAYVEVKKDIKAPSVSIQVDPLPAKPTNYSGGVGTFDIKASLDKNKVKAGDAVTLRIVISGTGNLKLIKQPEVELPKDFDKYDPKVTENTKLTTAGLTGSMTYDMLIVPRNKGEYTIPALEFVYFDVNTSSYKTLKTEPMHLSVDKGNGNGSGVTDYSQRSDNDIHDIMMGQADKENPEDTFFGSATYLVVNGLIFVIFIALLVIFRKRAMELADITAMRGKKANKVAGKRLKKAAKLMAQEKGNEFYDEVLRALWGYVGDKLNMPVEQLSRDNISDKLQQRMVPQTVIDSFIEAIDECEFARFAPGDPSGNMHKTYDKAVDAITNIEDAMKKKPKTNAAKGVYSTILILFMLAVSTSVFASDNKANGDAAYRTTDYQKAITLYEKELKEGVSAETYYNLGNAYYRSDRIPQAILAYERAKKLAPSNEDILHNLEIARNKTIDKLPPESEIFFVKWYASLQNTLAIDAWAKTALVSFIIALLLFLVYLFMDNMAIRRIAFYGSAVLLCVFIFANLFAWQQKKSILTHDSAIVMTQEATVKASPTQKSQDAFIIHEGTFVRITDHDIEGWLGIRLSDGREGWIKTNEVEEI